MVSERVKEEILKRVKMVANTKLSDANLIKAINMKIIPVAAYAMNICRSVGELKELDQTIKRQLQRKNILGKQASDQRLYLKREKRLRGLKSLRDTYKETRLRVTYYMAKLINRWIEAAWRRETIKEENAIGVESVKTMEEVRVRLRFEGKPIRLGSEVIDEEREWKRTWWKVKTCLQKAIGSTRTDKLQDKRRERPILLRTRKQMSSLVEPKLTRKEDILNHVDARTSGGDKIVESSQRIGLRRML